VGFSQLHTQGTGGNPSYGHFLISPQTGGVEVKGHLHGSPVSDEVGGVDYYTATLDRYGVKAEVATASNAALYRFTYPEATDASLVLDIARKLKNNAGGEDMALDRGSVTVDPATNVVTGGGTYDRNWNGAQFEMYFAMKVDTTPAGWGVFERTWAEGKTAEQVSTLHDGVYTTNTTSHAEYIGAYAKFATTAGQVINVKIATSFVSVAQAEQFLDEQIPAWDLQPLRDNARAAWNKVLGAVELGDGVSEEQKTRFYTALFHANVQPRDRTADIGVWDDYYTLWDSWKTVFPFLTLTAPDVVAANINSFMKRIETNGWVAETFTQGKECLSGQGGNEAENVIGDAYLKGLDGVDWEAAYQAATKNSRALRSAQYVTQGWQSSGNMALNGETYSNGRFKPASATMGFAINDHALAVMAQGLGHYADAALFAKRAQNWKNIWNPDLTDDGFSGFAYARQADGNWVSLSKSAHEEYNTVNSYYEANLWEGSYYPVFDIDGMVGLMGGPEKFTERLEWALEHGYLDYSNEPSFQTIWLLATEQIRRPDLASKWADAYLREFLANPTYPGDEDNGAMSTMYMFLMSGFFPFSGTNTYYLHGVRLPEITYHLANGKDFTIKGINAGLDNPYVQSATLNGKALNDSWITYDQIMAGGELTFVMGDQPSTWAQEAVPEPTPTTTVTVPGTDTTTTVQVPGATVTATATVTAAPSAAVQPESTSVPAAKVKAAVKAKPVAKSVKAGQRAKVKVTVTVPGTAKPAATVLVRYGKAGKWTTKAYVVKPAANGKATIRLPKLAKGTYTISVGVRGTDSYQGVKNATNPKVTKATKSRVFKVTVK
jgi:predicted alpha-1,2-mannosidase